MQNAPSLRSRARWHRPFGLVAGVLAGWSLALAANATEVRVFTAAAVAPVVAAIAPVVEKRSGRKLVVVSESTEALAQRILADEGFEVAVLPPALLEELGRQGAVSDGSIIPVARDPRTSTLYAGAVAVTASNSQPALLLLVLLASEETQPLLKDNGLVAP